MSWIRRQLVPHLAVLMGAVMALGTGCTPVKAPSAPLMSAPEAVTQLTVRLDPNVGRTGENEGDYLSPKMRTAMESALTEAGYRLVVTREPADLVVHVSIAIRAGVAFSEGTANRFVERATLSLEHKGLKIAEFHAPEHETLQAMATDLVNQMSSSPRVLAIAAPATPAPAVMASAAPAWPDLATPPKATGEGANDAALIMAVEDYYMVPKVPGAAKNATDWYMYLVEGRQVPVGQVRILRNQDATREGILKAAGDVGRMVKPGGTLWVVFIGHGAPSPDLKEGVLVGFDAQQNADALYARSVRQSELMAALGAGQKSVVVLDACFSGRASDGKAIAPTLQPLIPLKLTSGGATTLLTAGKAHEFAGPLPGLDRPAFSYLVLGALRGWGDANGDGTVTAQEAIDYATKALTILPIGRSQTPQLVGEGAVALSRRADEKGPSLSALVSGGTRGPAPQPSSDPGEICARAGSALLGCGFDNDPSWLGGCRGAPEYVACLQAAGSDCQALSLCGFRHFSARSCQGRGVPAGTAGCKATTACQARCGQDAACVCQCNEAMSPARAAAVGIQNQCAELHCKGCGGPGKPACDACFAQHCGAKFNRWCEGK